MTSRDYWDRAHVNGDTLETPGVDWGRPLKILLKCRTKLVVRRAGCKQWDGRWAPWVYTPTLYMLIELKNNRMRELRREEPGHGWRKVVAELFEECKKASAGAA